MYVFFLLNLYVIDVFVLLCLLIKKMRKLVNSIKQIKKYSEK